MLNSSGSMVFHSAETSNFPFLWILFFSLTLIHDTHSVLLSLTLSWSRKINSISHNYLAPIPDFWLINKKKGMLLCVLMCFHKDQFILQLQEVFNQLQHFHIFLQCSKSQSSVTTIPQIKSIICFKSVTCHILCSCTYFLYYIWCFLFKVKNPPLTLVSKGCAMELITRVPKHRVS